MKKVISYSLWGSHPKYTYNMVFNCIQAKHFFPDWTCRIYHDNTSPPEILKLLESFDNVELFLRDDIPNSRGMYWRHFAAADASVDIMISRDADSWVCKRDKVVVDEWLASNKDFHIVRDNCHHRSPIMGGMWGVRNGLLRDMDKKIHKFFADNPSADNNDQVFLNAMVYPLVVSGSFVHGVLSPPMEREPHAKPIPQYEDEELPGLPYKKAYALNPMHCSMCGKTHDVFIGCQITQFPEECLQLIARLLG